MNGRRKRTGSDHRHADKDALGCIEIENQHCRLSRFRLANDPRSNPAEMSAPSLSPWVKQGHDVVLDSARHIGALRAIAFVATPGEIGWTVAAEVLPGDDVFKMEQQMRIVVLVHQAILAAISRAAADQATDGGFHRAFFASKSRALACRMAMKSANAM